MVYPKEVDSHIDFFSSDGYLRKKFSEKRMDILVKTLSAFRDEVGREVYTPAHILFLGHELGIRVRICKEREIRYTTRFGKVVRKKVPCIEVEDRKFNSCLGAVIYLFSIWMDRYNKDVFDVLEVLRKYKEKLLEITEKRDFATGLLDELSRGKNIEIFKQK